MSNRKFHPLDLYHLDLEKFYTPDGNHPVLVSSGFFGGDVVYEPKTKKVYRVGLREVDEVSPTFLEKCELVARKKNLMYDITYDNIDKVEELLK